MIETKYPILLASKSPRRHEILTQAGFSYQILDQNSDESVPDGLPPDEVPTYVSKSKLLSVSSKVHNNIVICADTVVVLSNGILTKPNNTAEAVEMLNQLSDKEHQVLTGVSIGTPEGEFHLVDETSVTFKKLSNWEIDFYIKHWQPFDKAGGYGVQEFVGLVGVTRIVGSYFNVMGLPIHRIYEVLQPFIKQV